MVQGLGERLTEQRLLRKLSQKEVAQAIDVSVSVISNYEHGERTPSVETLMSLAGLYRCSVDYLLGIEDDDYSAPTFYTSSEEQELIKAYRQLSFDQQQVIKVQLGALVEVNK